MPGYELNGSQRFAFVAIRRARIYYQFVLDYDGLDWVSERQEGPPAEFFRALYRIPQGGTLLHFDGAGERRNPGYLPNDDSVHALWEKYRDALPGPGSGILRSTNSKTPPCLANLGDFHFRIHESLMTILSGSTFVRRDQFDYFNC